MDDGRDPRTRTPGGGFRPLPAGAPAERARTRSETHENIGELDKKIAVLETQLGATAEAAAKEFAALRDADRANAAAVTAMQPKQSSALTIAAFVFSIALPLAGIVFVAGKYPDQSDYRTLQSNTEARSEAMRASLVVLERDLALLRSQLESLNKELDRLEAAVAAKADRPKKR